MEDYEKKYKDAIERAKEINKEHTNKGFKPSDDVLYIFPELAVSEDEALRKELLQTVKESEESLYMIMTPVKKERIIAWLENMATFEIKEGHWYKCISDFLFESQQVMFKCGKLYYCCSDWRLIREDGDARNVKRLGIRDYTAFFRPATKQEIDEHLYKSSDIWRKKDKDMVRLIGNAITTDEASNYLKEKNIEIIDAHIWLETLEDRCISQYGYVQSLKNNLKWRKKHAELLCHERTNSEDFAYMGNDTCKPCICMDGYYISLADLEHLPKDDEV